MIAGLALLLACNEPAAADPESAVMGASTSRAPADPCVHTVAELPVPDPADPRLLSSQLVVVTKSTRRLMLFEYGKLRVDPGGQAYCWPVGLGMGGPTGPKHREGDLKTPEGWYTTSDKPWSQYYAAIAVHYPNDADAVRGLEQGQIDASTYEAIASATRRGTKPPQTTALGGEILIHGGGGTSDWTLGCVALDNDHIERLRAALPADVRTTVLILP